MTGEQSLGDDNPEADREFWYSCAEVEESVILDNDCVTLAHQLLKDLYYEAGRQRINIGIVDTEKVVNIFSENSRLALTFLDTHEQGALAVDERSNLLLVRGTVFIDPAQPPGDAYSKTVIEKLFAYNNLPSGIALSKQLSLPLLAAKGLIVEGGYLVLSRAYTQEGIEDALENGALDPEKLMNRDTLTVIRKKQVIYWDDDLILAPNVVKEIRA